MMRAELPNSQLRWFTNLCISGNEGTKSGSHRLNLSSLIFSMKPLIPVSSMSAENHSGYFTSIVSYLLLPALLLASKRLMPPPHHPAAPMAPALIVCSFLVGTCLKSPYFPVAYPKTPAAASRWRNFAFCASTFSCSFFCFYRTRWISVICSSSVNPSNVNCLC